MFPFELTYPGHWLDCPGVDPSDVHEAQAVFMVLESHLADAALALRLFELEAARLQISGRPEPDETSMRRPELEHARERELPPGLSPEDRWKALNDIRFDVDVYLKRERWAAARSLMRTVDGLSFSTRRRFCSP